MNPAQPAAIRLRHSVAYLAFVIAMAVSVVPAPSAIAQEGGGKNVVIANNYTGGRTMDRSGLAVTRTSGPSSVPENLARAQSSCTDCRTVAAAVQAVLIMSDADWIEPHNAAVAANVNCERCETMAYAYQYVVTTGGVVHLTPAGEQQVAEIRQRVASLAGSALPFPELESRFDALAAEFREVIDEEITRPGGGRGVAGRDVDTAMPAC